jgi:hypothetical protein
VKAAAEEDIFLSLLLSSRLPACVAGSVDWQGRGDGVARGADCWTAWPEWRELGDVLGVGAVLCDSSRVSRGANPGEVRSNRGPIKGALGVNRRVGKSWGRSWRAGDKKM